MKSMVRESSRLPRIRLADTLVTAIIERIARGEMEAGSRIGSELEIMQQYGLSRSIVREALRMLERDGLVSVRSGPNGGVFARNPGMLPLSRSLDLFSTFHDIGPEKLVEARLELEVLTARLAASRRQETHLEELERLNAEWKRLLQAEDIEAAAGANVEFHLALARAADNPFLEAFIRALKHLMYETALENPYGSRGLGYAMSSHEGIIEALRQKDSRGAVSQMRKHQNAFRPRWFPEPEKRRVSPVMRLADPLATRSSSEHPEPADARSKEKAGGSFHPRVEQSRAPDELFNKMRLAVVNLDDELLARLTDEVERDGIDPVEAIQKGCIAGIKRIGEMFGDSEIFLPELVRAGKMLKKSVSQLERRFPHLEHGKSGKVLLGTVEGDIHDIGKDLVATMLVCRGIEVVDIGVNCPASRFVDEALNAEVDIIGASCLLTSTLPQLGNINQELIRRGVRSKFKFMVGGAAVEKGYAERLGADGHGEELMEAAYIAVSLLSHPH